MQNGPESLKSYGHVVVPFYFFASILLTWPLARDFDSHIPSVAFAYDALLHVFLLGWGWNGLTTSPVEVFNAPIFYPEARTLTYMDHMLGEAVLAGPIIELFGLGTAYNSLVILSFVASAYFVYRLALLYGISPSGGCVSGFLFAFCPYRFTHLGCLNQIQTQFIPLGLYFAVQFVRTQRIGFGLGVALTLGVQSYFGWYSTFHLVVALLVLLGWEVLRKPGRWRRLPWRQGALLSLLSAALMVPSAAPYVLQRWAMPEFRHPFSETIRLSADLLDYLRVSPDNIMAQLFPSLGRLAGGFFPGLVATVLAVLAIVALWQGQKERVHSQRHSTRGMPIQASRGLSKWGEIGYLPILGLAGLVLSLGPILQVAGYRLWVPLPYTLFYYLIPGFSCMRTPGRFAILVALATAVLAGLGFDLLRARCSRLGPVVLAGTLLVAGGLAWCPNLPFVAYPDRTSMPAVYSWLAQQPDSFPLLEVPVPRRLAASRDVRRQMYVLYHRKPRLDGASGFTSNRYLAFRREMQAFPDPQAVRSAYEMGARRLIVHYEDYPSAAGERIRNVVDGMESLIEVADFGWDVAYEIDRP